MKDTSIVSHPKQEFSIPKLYSNRTKEAFFKVDPEIWSRFKTECKTRGVSVCHVLETLIEAWMQGQKVMSTVVNPVVINLTMEHIVKRPRRMIDAWEPKNLFYPPNCECADKLFGKGGDVGCLEKRNLVTLKECWQCYRNKNMQWK